MTVTSWARSAGRAFSREAGLRFLARRKAGVAVAVVTMALAFGVNTATFAIVDGFLLSSLGIPDSDRLFIISPMRELPGRGLGGVAEAYPNFLTLREVNKAFSSVATYHDITMSLDHGGELRPVSAARVTASLFETMRVRPRIGRAFEQSDEGLSPSRVALVSHSLWQSLGGNASAVGSQIILNGEPHTVIGVMPRGFAHPLVTDVWLPFSLPAATMTSIGSGRVLGVYGRLKEGVTLAAANADMSALATQLATISADNKDFRYALRTVREAVIPDVNRIVLSIQAAALMLLALATLTLASLLVAWGFDRRQEMAVRLALGARESRVLIMNLLQATVVIATGLTLGFALAHASIRLIQSWQPSTGIAIFMADVSINPRVVLWSVVGAAVVGLVANGVATMLARTSALAEALRVASRTSTLSPGAVRWQKAVVVGQSALSIVILFAAALIGITAYKLSRVPSGFVDRGQYVARVQFAGAGYAPLEPRTQFASRLMEGLSREPDILTASFTSTLPVGDGAALGRFLPQLPNGELSSDQLLFNLRRTSANYFQTIGIPLIRGRWFELGDDLQHSPVAIVSASFAARLWPGQDAIDRPLHRVLAGGTQEVRRVVGIVGDVVDAGYAAPPGETVYVPFSQVPHHRLSIVITPRGSPDAALRAAARVVKTIDPIMPITDVTPLSALMRQATAVPRLQSLLLLSFSCIAVAIVVLGSYGVMSQLVANRQREFALRMVFGADPGNVGSLVFGQLLRLTVPGILLGALVAFLVAGALSPFLFGVEARSLPVLAGVGAVVLTLALAATIAPAVRAMRIKPQSIAAQ
jgi:putative ABC transport system permease protein